MEKVDLQRLLLEEMEQMEMKALAKLTPLLMMG